ncbi:MAG: hypothetical protein SOW59_06825 [Corynebacterium sp.]|nr:hypothetical protein [Corynebacterium sp.]
MAAERNHSTAVLDAPRSFRSNRERTTRGSRDFSESARLETQYITSRDMRGAAGATMHSATRQGVISRTASPTRTTRKPVLPGHRVDGLSRLGSQQVLTKRGRRVSEIKQVSTIARVSGWAIALLITGIAMAMFFSGHSTSQTFQIQQLTYQESQLKNQLETLHRDVEAARSSADIARRAADAHLAVPVQPGIIQVNPDGTTTELRPATAETESIIDVNGQAIRPNRASSDPVATANVSGSLRAVPEVQQSLNSPYESRN